MKPSEPKNPKQKPDATAPPETDDRKALTALLPTEIQVLIASNFYRAADLENYFKTFALYLAGKAQNWQETKLEKIGWIKLENRDGKPGAEAPDANDICYTFEEMATRLMLHYQNDDKTSKLRITLGRKTLSAWSGGRDLMDVPLPPKDLPGARKRMSFNAWVKWFDDYLWHKFRKDSGQTHETLSPEISTKELEERAKRSRFERDILEDYVAKGQYIELAKSGQIAAGEMNRVHLNWKNEIESIKLEEIEAKMQGVGIEPEKVSAMKEYFKALFEAITTAIEDGEAAAIRELDRALNAEAAMNKK